MFDKLEDLLIRFEEVLNELGEPGVTDNQEHFQKLMSLHTVILKFGQRGLRPPRRLIIRHLMPAAITVK